MKEVELVVIGGGPAGICAALEASKLGLPVTLIDENKKLGGQIYRMLADGLNIVNSRQLSRDYVQGTKLIAQLARYKDRIEIMENALVWGIFSNKEIAIWQNDTAEVLHTQKLILAEGAYDKPIPFSGWTLPGVITAGAALRMVKAEKILPGERILLAGTGPLQLALGAYLIETGANIVAILEANSLTNIWKQLPHFWGQWTVLKDGINYLVKLKRARVPILKGYAILEAIGKEQVEAAAYVQVDRNWQTIPDTKKCLEVDTIISGYGLIPITRLTRLCGCRHKWDPNLGGWVPECDEHMETTVPGVFAAGDCTGIEGANVAIEEGRLAGIRASEQLGYIELEEAQRRRLPIIKRLVGLKKFEFALNNIFASRGGLLTQIPDNVTVCRCEEVNAGEIRNAIAEKITNINAIKAITRVGMGPCQGRMCESIIAEIISAETKQPIDGAGFYSIRPPVKPVPLACAAKCKSD